MLVYQRVSPWKQPCNHFKLPYITNVKHETWLFSFLCRTSGIGEPMAVFGKILVNLGDMIIWKYNEICTDFTWIIYIIIIYNGIYLYHSYIYIVIYNYIYNCMILMHSLLHWWLKTASLKAWTLMETLYILQ